MTTDASLPLPPPPIEPPPLAAQQWPAQQLTAQPWPAPDPLVDRQPDRVVGRAFVAMVGAGILGQLLFTFQLLGVNFPVWIAVVLLSAWRLRPSGAGFDRLDAWLPLSAMLFAGFVALRADGMLIAFDVLAAGTFTLASVVAFAGHPVTRSTWRRVVALGARAAAVYWVGAVYVLPGARPLGRALGAYRDARWVPVVRGIALALPLAIVFGALFAAADAIFQVQLRGLFNIQFAADDISLRLLVAVVAGWLFAGTMACAWLAGRQPSAVRPEAAAVRLGTVEVLVVLLILDAMFAVFAALQAAYLFAGADTFAISGMTYSDYARRGFFELIAVAFLAGGVIIALDRLVASHGAPFRLAAAALAAMTGIVVLSAFTRLGLYQAAYGWTELRFYSLAAIAWLAAGVVVTFVAVLANRARWLPQLIVGSGLVIAIACNVLGAQSFVTEQNLRRAIDPSLVAPGGRSGLDAEYLYRLGPDAVPAVVAARDELPLASQMAVDRFLVARALELRDQRALGWQSWNVARQRAADALVAAGY